MEDVKDRLEKIKRRYSQILRVSWYDDNGPIPAEHETEWLLATVEWQAREIAALKEIQQDVIDGAMTDLGEQVKEQAREIKRLKAQVEIREIGCEEAAKAYEAAERRLAECHDFHRVHEAELADLQVAYNKTLSSLVECWKRMKAYYENRLEPDKLLVMIERDCAALRPVKEPPDERP